MPRDTRPYIEPEIKPWVDALGRRRYPGGHTYVVAWPDHIVKAGFAGESRRWKHFVGKGAELLAVYAFQNALNAMFLENHAHELMSYLGVPAFDEKSQSIPYLGLSGGGWMECYRLPPARLPFLLEAVLQVRRAL